MFPQNFTLKNGQTLIIKEAVKADAPALLKFAEQVGGETDFLTFGPAEFNLSLAEEEAFIQKNADSPNSLTLVAEVNQQIVGGLNFSGGHRPRIQHTGEFGISVLQAYWGLGIGAKMIEALIDWAKATGIIRKINLRVRTDNIRAIELYRRFGFVEEGLITREFLLDDKFYSNIFMGLPLDQ